MSASPLLDMGSTMGPFHAFLMYSYARFPSREADIDARFVGVVTRHQTASLAIAPGI